MSQIHNPPAAATDNDFNPGDILFYRAIPGDTVDAAISTWEGGSGDFVHVAVAISKIQKIEAMTPTVALNPINGRSVDGVFRYSEHASPFNPTNLAEALNWLQQQVGQMYGWGDIVNAVLWKFEHGISIDVGGHTDCSDLGMSFLIRAGGVLPLLASLGDPHTVTPQELATALGVK